jgi:hypothetical protein
MEPSESAGAAAPASDQLRSIIFEPDTPGGVAASPI